MDFVERLFWSLTIFLGVHFIWLASLEDIAPIYFGTIISIILVGGFLLIIHKYSSKDPE